MDLNQVRQELEKNEAILIDVREKDEWEKENLKSARLLPLSQLESQGIPMDLPQNQPIYTHCRRGGRAEKAADLLRKKYPQVIPLKYAFEELKKAKIP